MELIIKKRFLREARKIGNKELALHLKRIFNQVKKANDISKIGGLIKLKNYKNYYRIRIKISKKRDYRLVFTIRKNKVWSERIALASKIFYKQ